MQKTNGWVIRLVGKHLRLRDSTLAVITWCFYVTVLAPYFWYKFVQGACARRDGTVSQYLCQLFGWCGHLPTLHGTAVSTTASASEPGQLRFVVMSDTHNRHGSLSVPEGDVLVHTGDFTNHGTLAEVADFARWFGSLPHPVKVIVPGNHDMIMDRQYYDAYWADWSHVKESSDEAFEAFAQRGVHVLIDSMIEIRGVRVYGSPHVPTYAPWLTAFNVTPDRIAELWRRIPTNVDVLLTHTPPAGRLDREMFGKPVGCTALHAELSGRVRPKFHVFGHVHTDTGAVTVGPTTFVNAASVTDFYSTRGRPPMCFRVGLPPTGDD
jgi:predicted phosphohydrolase